MPDLLDNLGGNTRERLEYLEWRLFWEGRFNKSDLMKQFGTSKPQASVDLRKYREFGDDNLRYDATRKRFIAVKGMKPKVLKVSPTRLLLQLRALSDGVIDREDVWFKTLPDVAVMPNLRTNVGASVLRRTLRAIRRQRSMRVLYRSLNGTAEREIAPHALAYDGHRWHARAWCFENEEFRDFVLTRIEKTRKTRSCDIDPAADEEWNNTIELKLRPNPDLTDEQRVAVEKDYGMSAGVRTLEVRRALAFYLVQNLDLDIDGLPPTRSQVRLLNRNEVFDRIDWKRTEVKIVSKA